MENIKFFYKNIEVIDKEKSYIEKRLGSIDKMINKIVKTEVEVGKSEKGQFRVEVMITTPRDRFRAEEVSESIEGSIDIVVDELKNQIRRKKDKIWTKFIRGARSIKKKMSVDKDARF